MIGSLVSTARGVEGRGDSAVCYALPTSEPINLDGVLDEPVWSKALRISDFTQRELHAGMPATERTEVAVAYDRDNLYVAVWCYDREPDKIRAKEFARDFEYGLDDNFILVFDTYRDKRNGFLFATNPVGARMDAQVFNNGSSTNTYWDGVWDVHTRITQEGWFAEFKIPLYTLKYRTNLDVQDWGINFERNIRRKREQSRWRGWNRNYDISHVNQAGVLRGLKELRNRQFVEFKPYTIGGAQSGRTSGQQTVLNGGGDVNYLLSPAYRLNVTVNTDFAQVESDQQQVNITRFPLFFPELRPFFLEGADYFDMGYGGNRITPFYTRRIGLDSNREAVPILAGARLLGKERNRTLGLMTIQTGETEGGQGTNYSVASWRQDVGEQSLIGAMSVNTFVPGRWHTTTGVRGSYRTSRLFGDKNLVVGATYVHTYDSDTAFISNAFAYRAYLNYLNDRWDVVLTTQKSPAPFDPEVGLMRRSNFRENFALFNYKPRPSKKLKWIRQFTFTPAILTFTQYDDTRKLQSFEYELGFLGFETRSGEALSASYKRIGEGLDRDFNLSDTLSIKQGEYWWNEWNASVSTFNSRTLSGNLQFATGEYFTGTNTSTSAEMALRLSKYLRLALRYQTNRIELPEGSLTTELYGLRTNYAINPNTFGSLIGQWSATDEELILNFRLRWIPIIGTDVFLIVNQVYGRRPGSRELVEMRSAILAKCIWRLVL